MKAFRFRLDTVLRVRGFELDRQRGELAEARRQAEGAKAHAATLGGRLAAEGERLRSLLATGVAAGAWAAARASLSTLHEQAETAERAAREAASRVATARGRVLEARRRVRSLELLRERAQADHRAAQARVEQQELDEVGLRRSQREAAEGAVR